MQFKGCEFDLTYDPYVVEMLRIPAFVEMASAFIHRGVCAHPFGFIMDMHNQIILPDWAVSDYLVAIHGTQRTFEQKPLLSEIRTWLIKAFDYTNILESDIRVRAYPEKTLGKIECNLSLNFPVQAFDEATGTAKAQMQRTIFNPANGQHIAVPLYC